MSSTLHPAIKTLNLKEVDFNPFSGPKLLKAVPTTQSQLEIWLSCMIGGEDANRSYNESISLRLKGFLNKDALVYSLEELNKRHEILQSTFSADGKSIFIYEKFPFNLDYRDLTDLSIEEQNQYISDLKESDAQKIFDLENGPLFRVYLLKLSEKDHLLKLSAHHIICDGWSFGIILDNLSKIYSAKINKEAPILDTVMPFSQYAKEELQFFNSSEYKETEKYWLNKFKNNVPLLDLPTDTPRPATRTFKSKRSDFPIAKNLIESLKSIGAKSGASLVNTLLVAFESYLYLLTKQNTLILGLPAAGQLSTGNYELVGHCVNVLPLKSNPERNSTFLEFLNKRKSEIMEDYDHQQISFGAILKELNMARDSSRIPLVPVLFNIDMGMDANVSFAGLEHELSSDPRSYENFELFLNVTGTEQTLIFEWSYNTQLFNSSTIQRMTNEFETLLEAIIADPQIRIKDISIQKKGAAKQIKAWNDTFSDYPKDKTVFHFINEAAIKNPTKTAVYFNDQELTYTQLNQQSNQFANYLIKQGVKKGDIIGLAVDRSPKMIIILLAIMKAGAAYLPLDPKYPNGRIDFMLEDSSTKYIITNIKHNLNFKAKSTPLFLEEIWPALKNYQQQCPSLSLNGNDLAYILYTSGSTGKPKGVQIEHHSLVNFLLSFQKAPGIFPDDKLLAITTISFDISATEFYLPLITGASILLVDSNTAKDGRELLRLAEEKEITIMQATPTTWQMMLSADWKNKLPLKVLCGGEPLSKDLGEKLLQRVKQLWNVYGPTETTIWSSIKQIIDINEPITIGRPIDNTQLYILDEHKNISSTGSPGELYIAGDGLARGYLNRDELTAEKFVANPFVNGSKMYASGDLGYYIENGEIICLGRKDAQVKIRGHRIELEEIEYNLVQQPGIKAAIVCAQGENPNDQNLLAYIIPDNLRETNETVNLIDVTEDQVQIWKNGLKELLPSYMIPNSYVTLNRFPTTNNGKIDRKSLPVPKKKIAENRKDHFVAPGNETEKLIAGIWSQFLSIDQISIQSNFFELGGHSLTAVRVMLAIEKKFGEKLPISTLFENSTIEKLAKLITGEKKKSKWESLVPIKMTGSKTPIYLVHGGGYNVLTFAPISKYMDPEQPIYALQGLGLYDKSKLLSTIEEIAQYYISEIREIDPIGPYALGGYSSGGLLAYEMARQLIEMGKEVSLLAMLDTSCDIIDTDQSKIKNTLKINSRQFHRLFFYTKSLLTHPIKMLRYLKREIVNSVPNLINKDNELFLYEDEINKCYSIAFKNYKMKPLAVKVDLFKVKNRVYFIEDEEYYGWKKHALNGVEVHNIQGEHNTFILSPYDKEFANIFQNVIDKNVQKSLIKIE